MEEVIKVKKPETMEELQARLAVEKVQKGQRAKYDCTDKV